MTSSELLKIISQGENETVQFRTGQVVLISSYGRNITGLLNAKGGKIIVGVNRKEEILGVEKEQLTKLKEFTLRIAAKSIRPTVTYAYEEVEIEKKILAVITIPEGKSKPYGYKGTYFKREGSNTVEMAQSDIFDFFSSQEKYDKRNISEILEKVKSIEEVLKDKIQSKFGTNIFISHGHHPEIREKVEDFLESLELNPIVVMDSTSDGLSVDDKVDKYIKNCSASIILYTPDDEMKDGTFLPRQNVIHETGILQREMPDKIVYLKEKTVKLPTNITPKVYVPFNGDNLTDAFIQIIRELKSIKVL